jgi:hypothetical protein
VSAHDWYERKAGPGVAVEFVDAFWWDTPTAVDGDARA